MHYLTFLPLSCYDNVYIYYLTFLPLSCYDNVYIYYLTFLPLSCYCQTNFKIGNGRNLLYFCLLSSYHVTLMVNCQNKNEFYCINNHQQSWSIIFLVVIMCHSGRLCKIYYSGCLLSNAKSSARVAQWVR